MLLLYVFLRCTRPDVVTEHSTAKQQTLLPPARNGIQAHSDKGFSGPNPEAYGVTPVPSFQRGTMITGFIPAQKGMMSKGKGAPKSKQSRCSSSTERKPHGFQQSYPSMCFEKELPRERLETLCSVKPKSISAVKFENRIILTFTVQNFP